VTVRGPVVIVVFVTLVSIANNYFTVFFKIRLFLNTGILKLIILAVYYKLVKFLFSN